MRRSRARRAPARTPRGTPVHEVVRVETIAAGGDGVARSADGRTLFVPRTAPGETVEVGFIAAPSARFARAELLRIVEPSDARMEAPCPHYDRDGCGGCQLQHLTLPAQRAAKARIVVDALARIGKREIALPEVVASPEPWHYRRKATFTLRGPRGGFHALGEPDRIIDIEECPITAPDVVAVLRAVRAAHALLPPDREWRVSARQLTGGGIGLVIEGGTAGQWTAVDRFTALLREVIAIWWRPREARRAQLVLDRRTSPTGDAAPAFAQVNAALAVQMEDDVVARLALVAPARVIDAYAGVGGVARRLAATGVEVVAIERDADACAIARVDAPPGLSVQEGAVEERLAGVLPADAILVNPPRTGLAAEVPPLLDAAAATARCLVYVSCDPATLARDLARLPRWAVSAVRCYDLFPQTAHVESVVTLTPQEANA